MKTVKSSPLPRFHAGAAGSAGVRVIDAQTGDVITNVIEADAKAGTVRRFAVEGGVLVREDNAFVVIDEKRAVRIEPAPASDDAAEGGEA